MDWRAITARPIERRRAPDVKATLRYSTRFTRVIIFFIEVQRRFSLDSISRSHF